MEVNHNPLEADVITNNLKIERFYATVGGVGVEVNRNSHEVDVIINNLKIKRFYAMGVEVNRNSEEVDVIINNLKIERFYGRVEGVRGRVDGLSIFIIVSCNRLVFSFKVKR